MSHTEITKSQERRLRGDVKPHKSKYGLVKTHPPALLSTESKDVQSVPTTVVLAEPAPQFDPVAGGTEVDTVASDVAAPSSVAIVEPTNQPEPVAPSVKVKREKNKNADGTRYVSPKWKLFLATPAIDATSVITLLATNNPKSRNAAKRFGFYKNGITVQEYCDAIQKNWKGDDKPIVKQSLRDVKWDMINGFIKLDVVDKAITETQEREDT